MTYERRIARGVALLDAVVPDWRDRVNPVTLDTGSLMWCVAAQAVDAVGRRLSFDEVLDELGAPRRDASTSITGVRYAWAHRHGFEASLVDQHALADRTGRRDYPTLTAEWRRYLAGELDLPAVTTTDIDEELSYR